MTVVALKIVDGAMNFVYSIFGIACSLKIAVDVGGDCENVVFF